MNFIKALLRSKTIQGILLTVGGALVKYAETSYPQYAVLINSVSAAFVSGGAVHAIHGRLTAAGPITAGVRGTMDDRRETADGPGEITG